MLEETGDEDAAAEMLRGGPDHQLVSWSYPRQAVTPLRPFFPPVACYRPRLTEGTRHRGPVLVGAHELLRSFSRCWEEFRSLTR
jgi:hypothetical protein